MQGSDAGPDASSTLSRARSRLRAMNSRHLSRLQTSQRVILNLALIVLVVFAMGCDRQRERERQYIEMSERKWAESVATNDSSVLERILADDFVWVCPDGRKMNKVQTIADARSGPGPFVSDHLDDVSVRFFGTTAVAQGSESWVQKDATGEKRGSFAWTDVWVR